jgi:hypothetical protein
MTLNEPQCFVFLLSLWMRVLGQCLRMSHSVSCLSFVSGCEFWDNVFKWATVFRVTPSSLDASSWELSSNEPQCFVFLLRLWMRVLGQCLRMSHSVSCFSFVSGCEFWDMSLNEPQCFVFLLRLWMRVLGHVFKWVTVFRVSPSSLDASSGTMSSNEPQCFMFLLRLWMQVLGQYLRMSHSVLCFSVVSGCEFWDNDFKWATVFRVSPSSLDAGSGTMSLNEPQCFVFLLRLWMRVLGQCLRMSHSVSCFSFVSVCEFWDNVFEWATVFRVSPSSLDASSGTMSLNEPQCFVFLLSLWMRVLGQCLRMSHSVSCFSLVSQNHFITGEISGSHGGDRPDDGGSKHLWSVGKLLLDYTAQHPRRQAIFTLS